MNENNDPGSENNNRDSEHSEAPSEQNKNYADVTGNGNTTTQASGDIIKDNVIGSIDEGRVEPDIFAVVGNISTALARALYHRGIGDRLEQLFGPVAGAVGLVLLLTLGNEVSTAEPTGVVGVLAGGAALVYQQASPPVLALLSDEPALAIGLMVLIGAPFWYRGAKFFSTCSKCRRPFVTETVTKAYPSRASFDKDGNRHVPRERKQWCPYCDDNGHVDSDESHGAAGQPMTDGGDGGNGGAGACYSSQDKERPPKAS